VFGDRIAVVDGGRIAQTGARDDLLRHPRTQYVAHLMGLNLVQGRVVSSEPGGITVIDTGNGRIRIAGRVEEPEVFLAIDPREVTLHTVPPSGSAQNVFAGPIIELVPEPPFGDRVRVVLGTTPPIVAEITARAVASMDLREGALVYATVKATAPHTFT